MDRHNAGSSFHRHHIMWNGIPAAGGTRGCKLSKLGTNCVTKSTNRIKMPELTQEHYTHTTPYLISHTPCVMSCEIGYPQ